MYISLEVYRNLISVLEHQNGFESTRWDRLKIAGKLFLSDSESQSHCNRKCC